MAGAGSFSYDVFVSFRGEDTRMGFTGNLYDALVGRGIRTFFDDKELHKGSKELREALFKAIHESRTAIVVLSRNYASSSFCLDELATIVDRFEKKKLRYLLPVFYDVDPSDVRHLRGRFGEALDGHPKTFKDDKNKWKKALLTAANLPGFTYNHGEGYEYEFIGRILKDVSAKINRNLLHVTEYPVGLESRVEEVKSLLDAESQSEDVVYMVGIYGIGGVGKSTIARAVYNAISDGFEGLCYFLGDVRVDSVNRGLVHLQETVLRVILGDKDTSIQNVNEGKSILKERLQTKKVLLVLDDVDDKEQLKAIVGGLDWFGSGSRVIITTRQERLLTEHGVIKKYLVPELEDEEALELLSWNAFKTDKIVPRYKNILNSAVTYASGLPLALQVIGSNFFRREEEDCKLMLDRYGRTIDSKIQGVLRVSFDSLEEEEKKVFLDIACCFGGYKLLDVENILHAHYGSSMRLSIELLIEKSLIKIDDELLTLHSLLQDMGREIVREESQEPCERSRLWYYEDVLQVLEQKMGTSKTQILILDIPKDGVHLKRPLGDNVHWDGEAIKEMKNLKTLIVKNGRFTMGPTHLPNSLRVLKWPRYPSQSLPCHFHPMRLSILELSDSCLSQCKSIQMLQYLTILDLSCNAYITEIPDVSGVRMLEKLSFKHCENLTNIHDSIGYLKNLKILDAANCKNLKTFPPIILKSLSRFNLSHCSILEGFPEILGRMENITELCIISSPIRELPISIQHFTRLRKLELQTCGMVRIPTSIVMLPELGSVCVSECEGLQLSKLDKGEKMVSKSSSLECVILSSCNISDDFLPTALTLFANVKDLNLSGNNFTVLDACFKECHLLRNLKLDDCRSLAKVRGIPEELQTLSVKGCTYLKFLDLTVLPACTEGCQFLKELILDDCVYLQDIRGLLPNLDHFSAKNCTSLMSSCMSTVLNQEWVETGNKMVFLPGTKIPKWFTHSTRGGSISFWFRNKFPAISICLVVGLVDEQPIMMKFSPVILINGKKQSLAIQKPYELKTGMTDHMLLFDVQLLKFEDNVDVVFPDDKWNRVEVSCSDQNTNDKAQRLVGKYSGIHLLEQTNCMEDIQFSKPWKQMRNVALDPNLEGPSKRIKTKEPKKDQTMVLSTPILKPIQPLPTEVEKGLTSAPTLSVERPREDFPGETSERLPEDEVCSTAVVNDSPIMEIYPCEIESEESSSNTTDSGSDSDDPFNLVDKKLSITGKETISVGDISLTSIKEALDSLERLMTKDLSEVSSDPALQSEFDHMLNQLIRSSQHEVTVEMKETLVEFQRNVLATFPEFQATIEPLKKLENFKKQKARIQDETSKCSIRWKNLKSFKKKASLALKAEKRKRKELELEIENIKKQIATKEMNLEHSLLNFKNQQTEHTTYVKNLSSLGEQARALSKEFDDLVAANRGIENEGKAAQVKQNTLMSTWSTDLPSHLNKIKNNVLHL